MYLKNISIAGFKNILEANVCFAEKINCITGINGSGKTNLLEAVYYLSMTKSYSAANDSNAVKRGEDHCVVAGNYLKEDGAYDLISMYLDKKGIKVFKKNGNKYSRLSDHIGAIPIVMVSPYDTCLINESGEERRKYMNFILSQLDRDYLRRIQNYNQILTQRNKLLKSGDINKDLLDTLSEQLTYNADYIFVKRQEFSGKLLPLVSKYYGVLSDGKEEVSIEYKSDLQRDSLKDLLQKNEEKDRFLGFTTSGIQRDDLIFMMDGYKFKSSGSQGQQKSFLISLKLSQFEIIKDIHGKFPILLLDDVFDKLDINRVSALLNMVSSDTFGQIFLTDSNKVRVEDVLDGVSGDAKLIEIEDGRLINA